MSKFSEIELFIFDCDGVLVDTELISNKVFVAEIAKFGFQLTAEEAWENFPGSRFASCIQYVEKTNQKKVPEEFAKIYREKSAAAFALEMEPIPGIKEILEALSLPKVVASNGPMISIQTNLKSAGLDHYFSEHHLFSAYTFQKWKPEPDMHIHVSKFMGIPAKNCLVIEDSVLGIQAAVAAGMKVVGFTHDGRNHKILHLGIPLIHHHEELKELVPHAWKG